MWQSEGVKSQLSGWRSEKGRPETIGEIKEWEAIRRDTTELFINSWAHPDSTCMDLALIIIPNTLRTKLIELHPDWPLPLVTTSLIKCFVVVVVFKDSFMCVVVCLCSSIYGISLYKYATIFNTFYN